MYRLSDNQLNERIRAIAIRSIETRPLLKERKGGAIFIHLTYLNKLCFKNCGLKIMKNMKNKILILKNNSINTGI